jgi:transcriptional regulator with XRE-family HTH domain
MPYYGAYIDVPYNVDKLKHFKQNIKMSTLLRSRQNLNLTQEELSEKSGVSVRTIQRIEAGDTPKGYTLKVLAKALDISEASLLGEDETAFTSNKWLKIINLSSLPFIIVPPLNFLVPLLIMSFKKEFNPTTRIIISIQLLWTLISVALFLIILMLNDWFAVQNKFTMSIAIVWVIINGIVILLNAIEISKNKIPSIRPNISIL